MKLCSIRSVNKYFRSILLTTVGFIATRSSTSVTNDCNSGSGATVFMTTSTLMRSIIVSVYCSLSLKSITKTYCEGDSIYLCKHRTCIAVAVPSPSSGIETVRPNVTLSGSIATSHQQTLFCNNKTLLFCYIY